MLYACGTCGVSALSKAFPPFHDWTYLLLAAFVLYNMVLIREGRPAFGTIFGSSISAVILFMLSAVMLAGLVWPVVVLAALLFFLKRVGSEDRTVQRLSLILLALFALTGVGRFAQAKHQGERWQLSRLQAGSPGRGYFTRAATARTFSDSELVEYIKSEDPTVARNAGGILEVRITAIDSAEELLALEQALGSSLQADQFIDLRRALNSQKKSLEPEQ